MNDIYKRLATHLDRLPGGFPATPNGIEIRILKRLFTPAEAQVAASLSMQPETVEAISGRLDMDKHKLADTLNEMARKGLIFRQTKDGQTKYMAAQFVIGIWEYHVNDLDPELIRDFNEYVPYLVNLWSQQNTKQLRVIPVGKSLKADVQIMPYEDAEQIIGGQSKITVAPCICRKEHQMVGRGCQNPLEVCLCFGSGAYYYEENGLGRSITKDEALDILHQAAEAGLVLQPGNSKKTMNICMCCGCCCQVLKNIKSLPQPAKAVNSSYYATVDETTCVGCGICEERCPMQAIKIEVDVARVDPDRCIGCGVCTPTCETGAVKLTPKPKNDRWEPPATVFETYYNIAKERGLI